MSAKSSLPQNGIVQQLLAIQLLFLACIFYPTLSAASDTSNVNAWVKRCGSQSPEDMRTRRVQGIFERVKSASDARHKQSNLYILECDGWPWAATLQDRNIILTRGAIEAVYGSDDSISAKDARLAFVLGHELKHVHEDDFWHEQVRRQQFMASNSLQHYGEVSKERRKHDERRADEDGFIYASLAGFETNKIFQPVRGEDSFLEDWAKQTSTLSGDTHFLPVERTEYLQRKFQSLGNAVELFKYGVRLAHFGRYKEALVLLEDFQNLYPSSQVFNNLGFVYLQMARREMPPEQAARYWYSTAIDLNSGVPLSTSRAIANPKLTEQVKRLLRSAVEVLERGIDKNNDSNNVVNLVTALMYLQDYSAARAVIETVNDWQSNSQLIALEALAVTQDKRLKDPWNTYSRENFESEVAKADAPDNLIYNYARLLLENGRIELAKKQFSRLTERWHRLPAIYRGMICLELQVSNCAGVQKNHHKAAPWIPNIKPGDDIDVADTKEKLQEWQAPITDKLDGIDAKIFRKENGDSLLALNGVVELVAIRKHGFDFKQHLIDENGEPNYALPTVGAENILSYGKNWSALVREDEVIEVWITR